MADRCSAFARAESLDPVGTAGSYDAFVLLEHPLPWPREITEDPRLEPLAAAVAAAGEAGCRVRVQGLVPPADADRTRRHLVIYRRDANPFSRYERHEHVVGSAEEAAALVAGDDATAGAANSERTEVLVCGHGRRDVCCGTLGTSLFQTIAGNRFGADVRLWRTSHTGGHRFAPTAITFPAGQFWAYLDADLLERIVRRDGSPADLAGHYRGSAALDSPALQAAEREAFVRHGWSWLDYRRTGRELFTDGDLTRLRLEFETPEGTSGAHEATIEVTRLVPVPDCGKPIEQAKKAEPELRLVAFG